MNTLNSRHKHIQYEDTYTACASGPDEVCPDAKAGAPKHWMPVSSMANAIAGLHNRSGGRVRLLYLQNCCKSTVLSMLSTQASADYVLASQPGESLVASMSWHVKEIGADLYFYVSNSGYLSPGPLYHRRLCSQQIRAPDPIHAHLSHHIHTQIRACVTDTTALTMCALM